MRLLAVIVALLMGPAVAPANANDLKPNFQGSSVEMDPRGGVMCIWMLYVSLKALAENCYRERDAAYIETLDWSIDEMEKFILRNSKMTAGQLAQGREYYVRYVVEGVTADRAGTCAPGIGSLYPAPDKIPNRQAVEADIRQLLSIDRPPSWNPCL